MTLIFVNLVIQIIFKMLHFLCVFQTLCNKIILQMIYIPSNTIKPRLLFRRDIINILIRNCLQYMNYELELFSYLVILMNRLCQVCDAINSLKVVKNALEFLSFVSELRSILPLSKSLSKWSLWTPVYIWWDSGYVFLMSLEDWNTLATYLVNYTKIVLIQTIWWIVRRWSWLIRWCQLGLILNWFVWIFISELGPVLLRV